MDIYTYSEIDYSRWEDVRNEYAIYSVVPVEPASIVPGPPSYDAHQMRPLAQRTVPMVTPVSASTASTTTAGSTSRRTLTDDDRRRICEYHESHPDAKQTEIGAMFGVERSTISKVLRQKEKFLNSNESQGLTKKAKGKFPDIERTLANWAYNERIKGKPLNDSKLQEQAQRFATVGNPESRFKLTSPAWLEKFKKKFNILDAEGHVVDSNTTSSSETPNSYMPVPSPFGELTPPPTSSNQTHRSDTPEQFLALSHSAVEPGALVKSEGQDESTSRMPDRFAATPVSGSAIEESLTAINPQQIMERNESVPDVYPAPTQDDARRALDLVRSYFRSQPAGFFEADEYAVVGKLIVKLSSISEGTVVLPGGIDESLGLRASKKRRVDDYIRRWGYSACEDVAAEFVSHINVY